MSSIPRVKADQATIGTSSIGNNENKVPANGLSKKMKSATSNHQSESNSIISQIQNKPFMQNRAFGRDISNKVNNTTTAQLQLEATSKLPSIQQANYDKTSK